MIYLYLKVIINILKILIINTFLFKKKKGILAIRCTFAQVGHDKKTSNFQILKMFIQCIAIKIFTKCQNMFRGIVYISRQLKFVFPHFFTSLYQLQFKSNYEL